MKEKSVKIPDPILGEPKKKPMPFGKKAWLIFFIGFFAGWLWMTWAILIEQPMGLRNMGYFRLLLPF